MLGLSLDPAHALWAGPLTFAGLGLVSGLHCLGMCGPLLLAQEGSKWSHLQYQLGRGAAYLSVGVLAGALGGRAAKLDVPNSLSWVFLLALLLLVAHGTFSLVRGREIHLPVPESWSRAQSRLATTWLNLARSMRWRSFAFGLGTVLLPCGQFGLFALASSLTGSPLKGGLVMMSLWLFGLPTSFIAKWGRQKLTAGHLPLRIRQGFALVFAVVGLWGVLGFASRLEAGADLKEKSSGPWSFATGAVCHSPKK